jgi:hypothetical protein
MSARPEQEESLDEQLEAFRAREKELSEKLEGGKDFGKTFWQLEQVRNKIKERIAQIPSSGAQGMTGESSIRAKRGLEPDRWRDKKED